MEGRTLQPEDVVARYRVVGPLGAGGMGEVYLARDESLERNVALKVLPADLVRDEERVRRFVLEAKSASSLSHPNIVTIYEIGQDVVNTQPVQYISMELIQGKTLGRLIHDDRTDLRTLLGYLAQAAEGVAKAHFAGIVHRDLKPGNIMVSSDGFAKVLDFGLAKLTERREAAPDMTSAPTRGDATGVGAVLGTAAYMSPEQVRGAAVDHRSDVFSFGCVLYEAATRTRPFSAETPVETMHKILHEKPAPIEEKNPSCPAELRRLIRRCLAKSPDQRVQSMKDLAIELREIADEWDTLSSSGSSGSTIVGAAPTRRPSRLPALAVGAGLFLAVVGIAAAIWAMRPRDGASASQPFQTMTMSTQTNRGNVAETAISSDGRYLAYLAGAVDASSVRIRQIATGTNLEVVPKEEGLFSGLSFSPDGNYLYYLRRKRDAQNYRSLMQVASLGGASREVVFDVDSRATFSPDGKQLAFKRGFPNEHWTGVFLRGVDGGEERELARLGEGHDMPAAPAWSPDGTKLAVVDVDNTKKTATAILAIYDVASGRREDVAPTRGGLFESIAWLPDGSGIVRTGFDSGTALTRQITLVDYPKGTVRRVTNDLNDYLTVSVSAGDATIAAVRRNQLTNLWRVSSEGGDPVQVTTFTSPDTSPFDARVCGDGKIVFLALGDNALRVWSVPATGGEPAPLTEASVLASNPTCIQDGVAYDRYDASGVSHVWRVDGSGKARPIIADMYVQLLGASRRGDRVLVRRVDVPGILVASIDGGAPRQLGTGGGVISPDGSRVLLADLAPDATGIIRTAFSLVGSDGGAARRLAVPHGMDDPKWSSDGRFVLSIDRSDPGWNVFRVDADGAGAPEPVTKFTEGRVTFFEPSPVDDRIAVVRRIGEVSNVWIAPADGSPPIQVSGISGDAFFARWAPDGKSLIVNAGRRGSEAVLIRNFR
jgi:serine/threonine protein kinase/Tol biopolymer transport system component